MSSSRFLPATRTEIFVQPSISILRKGDGYLACHTKARPDYWFGNHLILDTAPRKNNMSHWVEIWRKEYLHEPDVNKVVLQWETQLEDNILPVNSLPNGLSLFQNTVLVLENLCRPKHKCEGMIIRTASNNPDWEKIINLAVEETGNTIVGYENFAGWRFAAYRDLVNVNQGQWWGVWKNDLLLGSAGFFWDEQYACLQEVTTRIGFRRRGICSNMCYTILEKFKQHSPSSVVVVLAEKNSAAEQVYMKLGFVAVGIQWTILGNKQDVFNHP
jgi:FR47-like protein